MGVGALRTVQDPPSEAYRPAEHLREESRPTWQRWALVFYSLMRVGVVSQHKATRRLFDSQAGGREGVGSKPPIPPLMYTHFPGARP